MQRRARKFTFEHLEDRSLLTASTTLTTMSAPAAILVDVAKPPTMTDTVLLANSNGVLTPKYEQDATGKNIVDPATGKNIVVSVDEGVLTFTLKLVAPKDSTIPPYTVFTVSERVNHGDGVYSANFTLPANAIESTLAGNYTWTATYIGDANDSARIVAYTAVETAVPTGYTFNGQPVTQYWYFPSSYKAEFARYAAQQPIGFWGTDPNSPPPSIGGVIDPVWMASRFTSSTSINVVDNPTVVLQKELDKVVPDLVTAKVPTKDNTGALIPGTVTYGPAVANVLGSVNAAAIFSPNNGAAPSFASFTINVVQPQYKLVKQTVLVPKTVTVKRVDPAPAIKEVKVVERVKVNGHWVKKTTFVPKTVIVKEVKFVKLTKMVKQVKLVNELIN